MHKGKVLKHEEAQLEDQRLLFDKKTSSGYSGFQFECWMHANFSCLFFMQSFQIGSKLPVVPIGIILSFPKPQIIKELGIQSTDFVVVVPKVPGIKGWMDLLQVHINTPISIFQAQPPAPPAAPTPAPPVPAATAGA